MNYTFGPNNLVVSGKFEYRGRFYDIRFDLSTEDSSQLADIYLHKTYESHNTCERIVEWEQKAIFKYIREKLFPPAIEYLKLHPKEALLGKLQHLNFSIQGLEMQERELLQKLNSIQAELNQKRFEASHLRIELNSKYGA